MYISKWLYCRLILAFNSVKQSLETCRHSCTHQHDTLCCLVFSYKEPKSVPYCLLLKLATPIKEVASGYIYSTESISTSLLVMFTFKKPLSAFTSFLVEFCFLFMSVMLAFVYFFVSSHAKLYPPCMLKEQTVAANREGWCYPS